MLNVLKLPSKDFTLDAESRDADDDSIEGDDITLDETPVEFVGEEEEREQTKGLLKRGAKDTRRVHYWRIIVTLAILGTAAAVTAVTFTSLKKEENTIFETAFVQFARTVGDSAAGARRDLRQAYRQFADTITAMAESAGASWPLYIMPLYQQYAQNFLTQSRTELISLRNLVRPHEIEAWDNFTATHHQSVLEEAHMLKFGNFDRFNPDPAKFTPFLWQRTKEGPVRDIERDYYFPTLTTSPPARDYSSFQWNLGSHPSYTAIVEAVLTLKNETLVTQVTPYAGPGKTFLVDEEHALMHDELPEGETEHPHSFFFHPVRERINDPDAKVVGILGGGAAWDQGLRGLLPEGVSGILAVVYSNCGDLFTYEINGPKADFLGSGDKHDPKYDYLVLDVDLSFHSHPNFAATPGHCQYGMRVYPTDKFENEYHTSTPMVQAIIVAGTFLLIVLTFVVYDIMVQSRNKKMIVDAARSNAIVSQLFPGDIAAKMMNRPRTQEKKKDFRNQSDNGVENSQQPHSSRPLADLYLEATVLFADIAGFTAWSSVRSPDQVFELLETVYRHFDEISHRRNVFKVETIGDCYVAVAGIPVPRRDHALLMGRFARDIMARMHLVVKKLEQSLGPDTGELTLRIGIHSGPVTAGVLRGERARFQLFGGTVNTTSRLESCSMPGKILVSKDFADLLQAEGKSSWVQERADLIHAKGIGQLKSFWLIGASSGERRSVASMASADAGLQSCGNREERLVGWCCQQLEHLLKQIVALRNAAVTPASRRSLIRTPTKSSDVQFGTNFFEEVKEIIVLPEFSAEAETKQRDPDTIILDDNVTAELRTFVSEIAGLYNDNHFHNFEHASHVLMSVVKLMQRIVAPKQQNEAGDKAKGSLHDHTYGITSDPLTQFACAFAALIHDADHVGVSNAQLVKEDTPLAKVYKGKSVAEQNSLALSWELLMDGRFDNLRGTICATTAEQVRFRQLVVNTVMATDICDKELGAARKARWARAFMPEEDKGSVGRNRESDTTTVNRKATIVIEHLIQASDVSHMMQHWHVYRKWNTFFFQECYQAFQEGRADKDPAEYWYKGEIGFFDFYIIPLAKKLKECGVFGVSSGEYLAYAQANRDEWVEQGEGAVEDMVRLVKEGALTQPQESAGLPWSTIAGIEEDSAAYEKSAEC